MHQHSHNAPRTILLTGGTRGIGRATTLALLARGHRVLFTFQSRQDLARSILEAYPETSLGFKGSLEDPQANQKALTLIEKNFGPLDVLINNAGVDGNGLLTEMALPEIMKLVNTNLLGTLNLTQQAIPQLLKSKGQIINISSIWGHKGASCESVYAMTKGAIEQLTTSLARELGPSGVRSLTVAPGLIDTDMNQGTDLTEFIDNIPLKRMGQPEEVARLIVYLIEEGSYINGARLTIDGGYSI